MPVIEARQIQNDLKQGKIWPVYWIHGSEQMLIREIIKQIKKATESVDGEFLNGDAIKPESIVESTQNLTLWGGVKLIVVNDAHKLQNPEVLESIMGPPKTKSNIFSVTVFRSKDFDRRKKFSKVLEKKAAVISCSEIADHKKPEWVSYLARTKKMELTQEQATRLCLMDPWSLDIVQNELEILTLTPAEFKSNADQLAGRRIIPTDAIVDSFFMKNKKDAISHIRRLTSQPEEGLRILGLFRWNILQLILLLDHQENGSPPPRLNPYAQEKLRRWSRHWKLDQAINFQSELADLEFGIKQTQRHPLGLWTDLAGRVCVKSACQVDVASLT